MKNLILTILALAIAGCGGGGGGGEPASQASSVATPSAPTGSGSSSSAYDDGFCAFRISIYWCDFAGGPEGSDASRASAVHSQVSDTEPNDDVVNAVAVHWPGGTSAEQKIGFGVEGTVNAAGDVADFFAFTPRRSADFYINLCETGQLCGPSSPEHRLPLAAASVRILDQFGNEILSETLNPGSANRFETRFESGTLYYAVVVAEGVVGTDRSYWLIVGESLQQEAEEPSASVPEAPQLSAYIVDGDTNVQFDWMPPTHNEDGTQLTDLAGFKLYLYDYIREGDAAERLLVETIDDPSATTRTINLEGYRDWYVSITAFNGAGVESAHSNGVELVDAPE